MGTRGRHGEAAGQGEEYITLNVIDEASGRGG